LLEGSRADGLCVIVPAFNEAACLGATLEGLQAAAAALASAGGRQAEVVVVDNASTDGTAAVAAVHGVRVVSETVRNIARVRNTGARSTREATIVFVDADTLLPVNALVRIAEEIQDPECIGGAIDTLYRPRRPLMRWYLRCWRVIGILTGLAQGAVQFCRRDIFEALAGYDESMFNGEDIDFYWRLRKFAARRGLRVATIRDVSACTSSRRFDEWPAWRILLWTNPFFVLLFRRRRRAWTGWYTKPVR
jgi:glycosyltransferase involved in cell wall biosynthesis